MENIENSTRELSILDFMEVDETNQYHNKKYNNDRIEKNQQHYGPRKRIKPRRTGTKSQQQIVPKGFKKGFRK